TVFSRISTRFVRSSGGIGPSAARRLPVTGRAPCRVCCELRAASGVADDDGSIVGRGWQPEEGVRRGTVTRKRELIGPVSGLLRITLRTRQCSEPSLRTQNSEFKTARSPPSEDPLDAELTLCTGLVEIGPPVPRIEGVCAIRCRENHRPVVVALRQIDRSHVDGV